LAFPIGPFPSRPFDGIVYRAHNPRWSYAPTSGEGAARHGGRFNPRGLPALYTSLDPKTAWMEAQQGMPFKAQPMTLVAYRVSCEGVSDLTDPEVLAAARIDPASLGCPWELLAAQGERPPTWDLAARLIDAGVQGALVPSFAPGTGEEDRNLVLWRWSEEPPCRVQVIDDFGRLPKDNASWR
jgi:RES domain-containing protein